MKGCQLLPCGPRRSRLWLWPFTFFTTESGLMLLKLADHQTLHRWFKRWIWQMYHGQAGNTSPGIPNSSEASPSGMATQSIGCHQETLKKPLWSFIWMRKPCWILGPIFRHQKLSREVGSPTWGLLEKSQEDSLLAEKDLGYLWNWLDICRKIAKELAISKSCSLLRECLTRGYSFAGPQNLVRFMSSEVLKIKWTGSREWSWLVAPQKITQ